MVASSDSPHVTQPILDGSHLRSPADLDVSDRRRYQVGACLLTTTFFKDIGLVGVLPNTFPATPKAGDQEEDAGDGYERMDTSGLEVLGLPTQFGGQGNRKGGAKRQQPSYAESLERGDINSAAGAVAASLCTAAQLALPLAASIDTPAAQNLRAAVRTAQAEQDPSHAPACNSMAAGTQHAGTPVPALHEAAPAATRSQDGALASELGMAPGTALAAEEKGDAQPNDYGRISSQMPNAVPLHSSINGGPDAGHTPSSAAPGPDSGDRWQLQGVPSPAGSHVRFDSDEEDDLPSAAPELGDSEVIAQLQFQQDERGCIVISFDGRRIMDPVNSEQEKVPSQSQAGSRKRDTPTKAQRQWRHHPPNKQQLKALKLSAHVAKYWMQRYSLWSRYDEGVRMDEEGWFSATPEVIALHHAERVAGKVVVDAFCGVGGNAVHFARRCRHVIGVDNCAPRLQLAQQNARVYGVAGRLELLCANYFDLRDQLKVDAVYMSPPWGGPSYSASTFEVDRDVGGLGCNMHQLLASAFSLLPEGGGAGVILFLPRNTNLKQLSEALPEGTSCEVERAVLNGFLKGITVYIGSLADCAAMH